MFYYPAWGAGTYHDWPPWTLVTQHCYEAEGSNICSKTLQCMLDGAPCVPSRNCAMLEYLPARAATPQRPQQCGATAQCRAALAAAPQRLHVLLL